MIYENCYNLHWLSAKKKYENDQPFLGLKMKWFCYIKSAGIMQYKFDLDERLPFSMILLKRSKWADFNY